MWRDTSAPYTASFTAGRGTSYGVHTVSVRAFDAAGNARSTAVTVTRVRWAPSASSPRPGRELRLRASGAPAAPPLTHVRAWLR